MSVSLSKSGKFLACGTHDGEVYLLSEKKLLWDFKTEGRFNAAMCVSIFKEGENLAVGCYDGSIYWLDRNGNVLWKYQCGTAFQRGYVWNISISRDGNLAAGCHGNSIYFLTKEGKLLWTYAPGSPTSVMSVRISEDGKHICAGSDDKNVYFLSEDGELLWKYPVRARVKTVAISPDGEYISAGTYDGNIYFLNTKGEPLLAYRIPGFAWSISFSKLGGYLAVGSSDKHTYFLGIPEKVEKSISSASEMIGRAKNLGIDTDEAESLIRESESFYKEGIYDSSIHLANRAKELILDTGKLHEMEERAKKLRKMDRNIHLEDVFSLLSEVRKNLKSFLLKDIEELLTKKEYLFYRRMELLSGVERAKEDERRKMKSEIKEIEAKLYR
jgi:WD40 repeat protein